MSHFKIVLGFAAALLLSAWTLPTQTAQAHSKAHAKKLVRAYAKVRLALAADSLKAAKKAARLLARNAKAAAHSTRGKDRHATKRLAAAARRIRKSANIGAARLAFGQASKQLLAFLAAKHSRQHGLFTYRCPMAKGYKKWVQRKKKMGNPYMGKKMLMCGTKAKLKP